MSGAGEVCLQVLFVVQNGLHQQDNCCKKYNMLTVLGAESLYVWGATFCYVPVLLPVNYWILVFVIPVCCHHAEVPGGVCRNSVVTVRTSICVVVWGIHVSLVHLLTPLVHPLVGCSWLLFLSYEYQTHLCQMGHSQKCYHQKREGIIVTVILVILMWRCHLWGEGGRERDNTSVHMQNNSRDRKGLLFSKHTRLQEEFENGKLVHFLTHPFSTCIVEEDCCI